MDNPLLIKDKLKGHAKILRAMKYSITVMKTIRRTFNIKRCAFLMKIKQQDFMISMMQELTKPAGEDYFTNGEV